MHYTSKHGNPPDGQEPCLPCAGSGRLRRPPRTSFAAVTPKRLASPMIQYVAVATRLGWATSGHLKMGGNAIHSENLSSWNGHRQSFYGPHLGASISKNEAAFLHQRAICTHVLEGPCTNNSLRAASCPHQFHGI